MGMYDDLEATRRMWARKLFGRPCRPDYRPKEFWDETGRVVVAYLNLKIGLGRNLNKVDPLDFLDWLDQHADKLDRYEEGEDIDRAELVDEWLLTMGVK